MYPEGRMCCIWPNIRQSIPISLLNKRIRSYYNAILRNINTKKHEIFIIS
jgi:hypothetical protein